MTGTTGNIPKINQSTLISLPIKLPSLKGQQEIVKRVETLFAQADALEAQYESLKAKIEKLPQALLGKAFRGELVPQDPTNEPASVLLQKIKAETAKGGKKKEKKTIRLNWCFSEGGAAAKSLNQFIKIKSPMEFQR